MRSTIIHANYQYKLLTMKCLSTDLEVPPPHPWWLCNKLLLSLQIGNLSWPHEQVPPWRCVSGLWTEHRKIYWDDQMLTQLHKHPPSAMIPLCHHELWKKLLTNQTFTFTNKLSYSSLINYHLFVAVAVNATKGVLERTRLSLWSCWYSFLRNNKKSLWFLKLIKHMGNGIIVGLYMMLALERCIR